jgi:hypothetical protein
MACCELIMTLTDPGSSTTVDEFNEWYDNEHIPKLIQIPAFLTATRWKSVDGMKPTWAVTADIGFYDDTLGPAWLPVASTRSEREERIMSGLETGEVRTYVLYDGSDKLPKPSELYSPDQPARYLQVASVDVTPEGEEEFHKWYDQEDIPKITTIPGWVRSRRFRLKDWGRIGQSADDKTPVMKWCALHEYTNIDWLNNPKEDGKFDNEWTKKVMGEIMTKRELRVYELRRHWNGR